MHWVVSWVGANGGVCLLTDPRYYIALTNCSTLHRYVCSFLQAEKLRDALWWDATLKPLRSAELAARLPATAAAAAAAATGAVTAAESAIAAAGKRCVDGTDGRLERLMKAHEMRLKRCVAAVSCSCPHD